MNEFTILHTEVTALGVRISVLNDGKIEMGHVYLFFITNDLHEKPYALLEDLFVEESERSHGIGNKLLSEALNVAREHRCYKIIATSRTERENVHAWYERKGFEKFGYEFRMDLGQGTNSKEQ